MPHLVKCQLSSMGFALTQQRLLALLPKFSGLASFLFSLLVLSTVSRDKKKRDKTYHRLLLGMALADLCSSLCFSLSTWPIPKETGILWAIGNQTSCTFQGFFVQFGISSAIYNGSLSFYYLLVVRYGWREDKMKKIEWFLHGIPLLFGLGTAIVGLPLILYNPANFWCSTAPTHDRGAHAQAFRWAFFYGPLWLTEIVVTINLMRVFVYVRRITKSSEGYVFGNRKKERFQDSTRRSFDVETGMSTEEMNSCSAHHQQAEAGAGAGAKLKSLSISTSNSDVDKSSRKSSFLRQSVTQLRKSIAVRGSSEKAATDYARKRRQVANQCFRYALAFYVTWIPITVRKRDV